MVDRSEEWRPIEQALAVPAIRDGLKKVLIGCFYRNELVWAMLATYGQVSYGYVQCASRSGWAATNMPEMARDHRPFKYPGEWINGAGELAPTHYRYI